MTTMNQENDTYIKDNILLGNKSNNSGYIFVPYIIKTMTATISEGYNKNWSRRYRISKILNKIRYGL
jgi:hypothetical protein